MHVQGWRSLQEKNKLIYVRYKDLNKDFDKTVRKIAKQLGQNIVSPVRPSKTINVVTPVIDENSLRAEMGGFR